MKFKDTCLIHKRNRVSTGGLFGFIKNILLHDKRIRLLFQACCSPPHGVSLENVGKTADGLKRILFGVLVKREHG